MRSKFCENIISNRDSGDTLVRLEQRQNMALLHRLALSQAPCHDSFAAVAPTVTRLLSSRACFGFSPSRALANYSIRLLFRSSTP